MQINANNISPIVFEKAKKYLPVRLSTTSFDGIGECMCIVANRADGMTTEIVENINSEVFITLMNSALYEDIKRRVLNMDYWVPNKWYNTIIGFADGIERKIHLDCDVF